MRRGRQRLGRAHPEERRAEPDDERHRPESGVRAGVRVAGQGHRRSGVEQGSSGRQTVAQDDGRCREDGGNRFGAGNCRDAILVELLQVVDRCRAEPNTELGRPRFGPAARRGGAGPARRRSPLDRCARWPRGRRSRHRRRRRRMPRGPPRRRPGSSRPRRAPHAPRRSRPSGTACAPRNVADDAHRQPIGDAPNDAKVAKLLLQRESVAGLALDRRRAGGERRQAGATRTAPRASRRRPRASRPRSAGCRLRCRELPRAERRPRRSGRRRRPDGCGCRQVPVSRARSRGPSRSSASGCLCPGTDPRDPSIADLDRPRATSRPGPDGRCRSGASAGGQHARSVARHRRYTRACPPSRQSSPSTTIRPSSGPSSATCARGTPTTTASSAPDPRPMRSRSSAS